MKRLIGFCCKDIPGCEGGPDETDTTLSWDGGGRLLPLCTNASWDVGITGERDDVEFDRLCWLGKEEGPSDLGLLYTLDDAVVTPDEDRGGDVTEWPLATSSNGTSNTA